MASIIKRGKFFRAYVARRGYKRQSRTFDTKAEAEAWAKSVESEMARRTFRDNAEAFKLKLSAALTRYEEGVSAGKKGHRQERSRIAAWQASKLADLSLGELRPAHFAEYRDAMKRAGKAENTIRLSLALISHLFTVARREWGLESLANPLEAVTKPKGSRKRERRMSDAEVKAIMAADNSKNRVLSLVLQLALETAMRRSELVKTLQWRHIDLDARVAHLPDTKGGVPRNVPLSANAVELLQGLPGPHKGHVFAIQTTTSKRGQKHRLGGINPDGITLAFRRARTLARANYENECMARGIEPDPDFLTDVRFHDARHEATSALFEKGLNVMEAAAVTGHRDLKTLQRYTHLSASRLAAKLDHPVTPNASPAEVPHPGKKLREYLPNASAISAAAKKTGIAKAELGEIVEGRARIDASTALRLEALGPAAELWIELQAAFDLAQARLAREAAKNRRKPGKSAEGEAQPRR
jgi:addiction module HigA family antidote